MTDTLVEKTLLKEAVDFLLSLGFTEEDIATENVVFDPSGKPKWAKLSHMPNIPVAATIGIGGQDRETGVFQIDFNIPQGKGSGQFRPWLDAARAKFVAGASFIDAEAVSPPVVVIIGCGSDGNGRSVDNYFRKSVSVLYRADLTRTAI